MKIFKLLSSLVVVGVLLLAAFKNEQLFQQTHEKITIVRGDLSSIAGPKEEIAILKSFPKALYRIYTIDNLGSFYIDSREDIIKNDLRSGNVWEQNIVDLIEQYAGPGSTAIDIGAHIGTHTLSMSKFVGDNGRVVAFEPQIKLFSELVMNMSLNDRHNVTAYRAAVGDTFKTIEMGLAAPANEGGTKIGKGGDTAEMIPLDSLHLENVSFIKIDVENFESEVLAGAKKTILRNHPYMIIEIMGNIYEPIPDRTERVYKTLKQIEDMGYSLEYIEGSWSDWLATPKP